jgi:hypothetical protein
MSSLAGWAVNKLAFSERPTGSISKGGPPVPMDGSEPLAPQADPTPSRLDGVSPGASNGAASLEVSASQIGRTGDGWDDGDGWDEDEDFFDALGGKAAKPIKKQAESTSAAGWGAADDWDFDDDIQAKASKLGVKTPSSATSSVKPVRSGSNGGLESESTLLAGPSTGRSAVRPSSGTVPETSARLAAPLSADDLLSMLDDRPPLSTRGMPAVTADGLSNGLAGGNGARSTPLSGRQAPSGGITSRSAETKVAQKRLQAKKLVVKGDDWDEF